MPPQERPTQGRGFGGSAGFGGSCRSLVGPKTRCFFSLGDVDYRPRTRVRGGPQPPRGGRCGCPMTKIFGDGHHPLQRSNRTMSAARPKSMVCSYIRSLQIDGWSYIRSLQIDGWSYIRSLQIDGWSYIRSLQIDCLFLHTITPNRWFVLQDALPAAP